MKRRGTGGIRKIAALLLLTVAFGVQAANAQRFAVVDLQKVFREYRRSRIAEDAIKQQAEIYRGYLVKQTGILARLKNEADDLRKESQNPALSDDERDKYGADAVLKTREVAAKQADLQLYAAERSRSMRELEQKKRAEIMVDIYREINRRAAAEGFDFVLDSSGKTMNEQPAVLIFPATCDLTEAVIRELNRTMTEVKTPAKSPAAPDNGTLPAGRTK